MTKNKTTIRDKNIAVATSEIKTKDWSTLKVPSTPSKVWRMDVGSGFCLHILNVIYIDVGDDGIVHFPKICNCWIVWDKRAIPSKSVSKLPREKKASHFSYVRFSFM